VNVAEVKMRRHRIDVYPLMAVLNLLNDVPGTEFRSRMLNVKILDSTTDIE
jgi:hypothetical protein